jgi:hypothetical protein
MILTNYTTLREEQPRRIPTKQMVITPVTIIEIPQIFSLS